MKKKIEIQKNMMKRRRKMIKMIKMNKIRYLFN